jgi:membrane protein implicated in regulation of membrane protease activity
MGFIKRIWTGSEAEEWTKEDTLAVIISPIIYMLVMVGAGLSALLIPVGFVLLLAGIALAFVLVYVINPKLTAVSEEYEKKQKQYLDELEKKMKWED